MNDETKEMLLRERREWKARLAELEKMSDHEIEQLKKTIDAKQKIFAYFKEEKRKLLKRFRNMGIRIKDIPKEELENFISADYKLRALKDLMSL